MVDFMPTTIVFYVKIMDVTYKYHLTGSNSI